MRSFRFQLLVLIVAATAANGAGPQDPARRVVFLLDRSGSMPQHSYPQGFASEVTAAKRAAATILEEVDRFGETSVGFHTFGNKDALQHFHADTAAMSPVEAKGQLNEFFSADPTYYNHGHTYIAYSIFNLVKQELGLGPDFGPDDDIPEDAPLLNVFVFTDGGEDYQDGFDNGPYEEWVRRHADRLQVRWQTWKFFAAGDERVQRDHIFAASPADFVTYSVHFGVPSSAYSFSNVEPPANRTVNLEVPRLIRMIPAIPGDPLSRAEGCTSEPSLTDSDRTDLLVQAQIEWPASVAATSEWTLHAPERKVLNVTTPDHATPVRTIDRHILYFNLAQPTAAVLDVSATAGRYPIRLVRQSLCEQLKHAYPSSKFVFPASDHADELPPIGYVTVENVPVYTFAIASQNATRPNDRLGTLVADRWHRYRQSSRILRVTPPPATTAVIDVTVLVRQGGKTLPEITDFVALAGSEGSGGAITARPGENFTISVPATRETLVRSLLEQGFDVPPGDYELVLRLRPRISGSRADRYKTRIVCENCDPSRFMQRDDYALLTMPVTVEKRPLSWIAIALIAAATLFFLWALIKWLTRPQFPEGFTIGTLESHADLRSAHRDGLRGMMALFWRKPLYVDLRSQGRTIASRVPFTDTNEQAARNLIGLRPSRDRVHLWCVVKSADDVRIEILGNRLEPRGSSTPSPDDAVQLLHADLYVPSKLTVTSPTGEIAYTVESLR